MIENIYLSYLAAGICIYFGVAGILLTIAFITSILQSFFYQVSSFKQPAFYGTRRFVYNSRYLCYGTIGKTFLKALEKEWTPDWEKNPKALFFSLAHNLWKSDRFSSRDGTSVKFMEARITSSISLSERRSFITSILQSFFYQVSSFLLTIVGVKRTNIKEDITIRIEKRGVLA